MVAKIHATLVTSFLLLGVITGAPSNPDSETVQGPAEDAKSPVKRSTGVQSLDSRHSIAVITDRYSGFKVLRPFYTGFGVVWKEVATSYGDDRIRIRDRGDSIEVSTVTRNNQTVPIGPSVVGGPNGVQPDANGQGMGGGVPFGYVSNGNVPTGNALNGNVPGIGRNGMLDPTTPNGGNRRFPTPQSYLNNFGGGTPSTNRPGGISPDANLFSAIVNDFTFKLVETMKLESNFVVSPISVFVALSMCYLGSGGRTKAQLEQVLGLNDYSVHETPLHHGISDLLSMFSPDSDEYRLFVANGLFLGRNFNVEEPFREEVQRFYNAELKNMNFGDQVATIREINEWVAKKTMGAIPSLVNSPFPIPTRLVLLNAIFFNGIWKTQFPLESTADKDFFPIGGGAKKVPFMKLFRETFPIHRSEEHRHSFIKLPYKGGQVSMIIAMPFANEDPPMPSVRDQILCHVQDAMKDVELSVTSIPRFRIEYLQSLRQPLMQRGLGSLFGLSVNLTAMRKENDIFVSDILQKAVVEVTEEGTTASAVTDVNLVSLSSYQEKFIANHPFAFYIVHEASGLVLFYGKVFDLEEGEPSDDRVMVEPHVKNDRVSQGRRPYQRGQRG